MWPGSESEGMVTEDVSNSETSRKNNHVVTLTKSAMIVAVNTEAGRCDHYGSMIILSL